MKRRVIDAVLGLAVALCLAIATPASALNRIYNMASVAGQPLYLSVYGGPQCQDRVCWLPQGASVILWDGSSGDQLWNRTIVSPRAYEYTIQTRWSSLYLSVFGGSTSDGASVIVWGPGNYPNLSSDQRWQMLPASYFGAPTVFDGCYVIRNSKSGKVLAVPYGDVFRGAQVVQWSLIVPQDRSNVAAWHHDQFWCVE